MNSKMFYLIPVLLVALSAYVGWHLWMLPPVAAGWRWALVAVVALVVGLAVFSLTRWLDRVPMGLASFAYNVGNRGLIVLLYLLMLCLLVDLLRLVHVVPTAWVRDNWWACGVLLVVMGTIFIYGRVHYEHKARVAMRVDSHGKVEQPLKVLALSDLHLDYHNRRSDLARWVDKLNAECPDLIVIAGDIIDRSLRPLREEDMAAELRRLSAPVYACLGNHEYYADHYSPGEVVAFYRDAGITLLQDSVATVGDLVLLGRDDRTNPRRLSVRQLQDKFSTLNSQFSILLDHQPYHLEEAEQAGIDLQISGHTHRGQVWPLSWITDALYECAWGTHQRGSTAYYVSSGLGIWGAKYRIGTQSEYTVIDIF